MTNVCWKLRKINEPHGKILNGHIEVASLVYVLCICRFKNNIFPCEMYCMIKIGEIVFQQLG